MEDIKLAEKMVVELKDYIELCKVHKRLKIIDNKNNVINMIVDIKELIKNNAEEL